MAFKREIGRIKPDVFVSIHSGTLGMYTPYAYSMDEPQFNEQQMLDVIDPVNKKYFNCPSGAAGDKVGYLCPGTSMDYIYDNMGAKYTYSFEIYRKGSKIKHNP